jgi:hypothetical protein
MKRKSNLIVLIVFCITIAAQAAPPPNDDYTNAIPVGEVTDMPFNTTDATPDGPHSCYVGDSSPNIWFIYTALYPGLVTIDLCGSSYDTMLAVYDGTSPSDATFMICNDDYCGLQSQVTFWATAGNQYLIEIGGFGTSYGSGDISIIQLEIEVPIDIKPTSCPNPLNVNSKGVLPVAILGTEFLDVSDVDVSTVSLACVVAPLRFDYEDVATPFEGELCDCHELGPDGYMDLTLKFDTQMVVEALGDVEDGEILSLPLLGYLNDGTPIEGSDCIRIIKKGKD